MIIFVFHSKSLYIKFVNDLRGMIFMFTGDTFSGFVMGIREGLEAFLIIVIMLKFLSKSGRENQKIYVFHGLAYGIFASLLFGTILLGLSNLLGSSSDNVAKLWESVASFVALILITTFIYFMLKNRDSIVGDIKSKLGVTFSKWGIISLAAVMVAREGAEIVLFVIASADQGNYIIGALTGVISSSVIVFLIYKSLIKVDLRLIFNITLFYLILQAGFMLGYSVHEFLSYLKAEEILLSSNAIYTKAFDMSGTFLAHKDEPIGIALYALFGWYSKPEVIQFVIQYGYTIGLLYFFFKRHK